MVGYTAFLIISSSRFNWVISAAAFGSLVGGWSERLRSDMVGLGGSSAIMVRDLSRTIVTSG